VTYNLLDQQLTSAGLLDGGVRPLLPLKMFVMCSPFNENQVNEKGKQKPIHWTGFKSVV
jgi:hypothetical protein